MSEKYYYTKNLAPEVLVEAIQLRTSVRLEFTSCRVSINHDGSIIDDNIELQFSRALTSVEQDELVTIVNDIGPEYDLAIRKNIEKNTMAWARQKGTELMDQFAANNIYRQKSPEQVEALAHDYPNIIHDFTTGSLQTAYTTFSTMIPDANISQEEIDEFKLRIAIILGM